MDPDVVNDVGEEVPCDFVREVTREEASTEEGDVGVPKVLSMILVEHRMRALSQKVVSSLLVFPSTNRLFPPHAATLTPIATSKGERPEFSFSTDFLSLGQCSCIPYDDVDKLMFPTPRCHLGALAPGKV